MRCATSCWVSALATRSSAMRLPMPSNMSRSGLDTGRRLGSGTREHPLQMPLEIAP